MQESAGRLFHLPVMIPMYHLSEESKFDLTYFIKKRLLCFLSIGHDFLVQITQQFFHHLVTFQLIYKCIVAIQSTFKSVFPHFEVKLLDETFLFPTAQKVRTKRFSDTQ